MSRIERFSPQKDFLSVFSETARYHDRREVFRDFITIAAIDLAWPITRCEKKAQERATIIKRYKPEDQEKLARLFAIVVTALEAGPEDFLGPLFMDLEMGDARRGQFFTPHHVSKLMAEITLGQGIDKIFEEKPFISLSEPAAGSGGMILAVVDILVRNGYPPHERLFVQAVDIDRLSAMMCFIQLSLWGVPAEVVVGDTLRLESREVWHTPIYHLHGWHHRRNTNAA